MTDGLKDDADAQIIELSEDFQIVLHTYDRCQRLEFDGALDEPLDDDRLVGFEAESLILDFHSVDRITSFGIREWLKFLSQLRVDYYCFVRCPATIVAQLNMVYKFSGDGELVSLYLPYLCPDCGHEFSMLADLRDEYPSLSAFELPSPSCPTCGADADFDDLPELYFEYVSQQGPPSPPPAVEAVLDGKTSDDPDSSSQRFRVRKEIAGKLTALWAQGTLDEQTRNRRITEGLEDSTVMICSEIEAIEPEGLGKLLEPLDGELYLARVTLELLRALDAAPDIKEASQPITIESDVECTACDWTGRREVELASLIDSESPDIVRGCPQCYADVRATLAPDTRAFIGSFNPPPPPPEVASYLTHCETDPGARRNQRDVDMVVGKSFGRYTLRRQIRAGGMAEIFLASQHGAEGFERKVVIKRLLLEKSAAPDLVESFIQEAKFAGRLTHPSIVQVTDFGQTNQFYYIAMEYIDGPDLRQLLRQMRQHDISMPPRFAVFVAVQMCDALQSAHTLTDEEGNRTPIIHRDVSPHNILISSHGTPKLTDFGIARIASDLEKEAPNTIRGKIAYMAPETIAPAFGAPGGHTDMFSLGTVLYECLTGQKPFDEDDRQATLNAILRSDPPPPTRLRSSLPEPLAPILRRAMAQRPDDRFETIRDFQKELEDVLHDLGVVTNREFGQWMVDVMGGETDASRRYYERIEDRAPGTGTSTADDDEPTQSLSDEISATADS